MQRRKRRIKRQRRKRRRRRQRRKRRRKARITLRRKTLIKGDGRAEALEQKIAVLIKRPAACKRLKFSKKPTSHHGGRIYWLQTKKSFRVYAHTPDDKVEKMVPCNVSDDTDKKRKWAATCAMIESDPRPID